MALPFSYSWRSLIARGTRTAFTVVVIVAVIAVANVLLIRPLSHDQPGKRR